MKKLQFTPLTPGSRLHFAVNREARQVAGGYQLWQTTDQPPRVWVSPEGHESPVFESLEDLAEWAAANATTFADKTATREEWLDLLS